MDLRAYTGVTMLQRMNKIKGIHKHFMFHFQEKSFGDLKTKMRAGITCSYGSSAVCDRLAWKTWMFFWKSVTVPLDSVHRGHSARCSCPGNDFHLGVDILECFHV